MINFSSKPFLLPGFPLIEQALNLFRVAVEGFVRDVNKCPIVSGNHLTGVSFVATQNNTVNHKLGRTPVGWILTSNQTSFPLLYEVSKDDKTLVIFSTYTCTVSIWVF